MQRYNVYLKKRQKQQRYGLLFATAFNIVGLPIALFFILYVGMLVVSCDDPVVFLSYGFSLLILCLISGLMLIKTLRAKV